VSSVTSHRNIQTTRPDQPSVEWNLDALREVWARQQGQVQARICLLQSALAALAKDQLQTDRRREAERAAHTLAGSLGMFGFVAASNASRELEVELAHPAPRQAPKLSALLEQVQAEVTPPVLPNRESIAIRRSGGGGSEDCHPDR
jgi:HPt (histidine-containing phosphotransfer) domain-containing protein